MPAFDDFNELARRFAPFLVVIAAVILCLSAVRWLLLRRSLVLENERKLPRQLTLIGLSGLGIVAIVMSLPVADVTRNQLLTVLGLLASGIIALSSTTIVANAMAGLMLHSTKGFRTGDFIRVENQFGRVTERRFLHTEIQTEHRELTTLPNLYLISHPVTVVRSSGTLVSVSLSLGYDVHHARVEPLFLEAVRRAELNEPFVLVSELGNFAVTYRVFGFLADIKNLITVRSNLCKRVLDVLHGEGIEIVSPTFMNQRQFPQDGRVIPVTVEKAVAPVTDEPAPEEIMFDKAERAEHLEGQRLKLQSEITAIEGRLGQAEEKKERIRLQEELDRCRKQLATLANVSTDVPATM